MLQNHDDHTTGTSTDGPEPATTGSRTDRLPKLYAIAKQAGVKSMLHSCGSVRDYIPELIEAGVDILNPIEVCSTFNEPVDQALETHDD